MPSEAMPREELIELAKVPGLNHYTVTMQRPGGRLFTVKLEYGHFPPRTELNDLFQLRILPWPIYDGKPVMHWLLVTIPSEYHDIAVEVAKECELAAKPHAPGVFSPDGFQHFPFQSDNLFTLESLSGSLVYQNEPMVDKILGQDEDYQIREIIEGDKQKYIQEMRDAGFTQQQIDYEIAEMEREADE